MNLKREQDKLLLVLQELQAYKREFPLKEVQQ